MRILGIESSAAAASAAIVEDGKLLAETYLNAGLTHSQTLLQLTDACLAVAGLGLEQIDALAVANGPGSFTGVRIGVSLVKGLCFPDGKPAYAVSTLEATAWAAALPGVLIAPVMDARCGQVYTAGFVKEAAGLKRVFADEPLTLEALAARAAAYPLKPLFIGDGAAVAAAYFAERGLAFETAPEIFRFQRASAVAFAAWRRYNNGEAGEPAGNLRPAYLRLAQAERERAKKRSEGSANV